jgi:hypothetical protein
MCLRTHCIAKIARGRRGSKMRMLGVPWRVHNLGYRLKLENMP